MNTKTYAASFLIVLAFMISFGTKVSAQGVQVDSAVNASAVSNAKLGSANDVTASSEEKSKVKVSDASPTRDCSKIDADGNGIINENDFPAFQNYFKTGNLRADIDGSKSVNVADFTAFLQGYALCPHGTPTPDQ